MGGDGYTGEGGSYDDGSNGKSRATDGYTVHGYPDVYDPDADNADDAEVDDRDDAVSETDSQTEWNNARTSAHATTPAWRRASPRWIYPYIVGATLAMGMGMAPRSELYIDLACLAHPPEAPASMRWGTGLEVTDVGNRGSDGGRWGQGMSDHPYAHAYAHPQDSQEPLISLSRSRSASVNSTYSHSQQTEVSPADKWFLKLQRDIYEYDRAHRVHAPVSGGDDGDGETSQRGPSSRTSTDIYTSTSASTSTTQTSSPPSPTGPLPRPDEPDRDPSSGTERGDGGSDKDGEGEGGSGDDPSSPSPSPNGPPFRMIDPALCKKSPTVQAAAAKLTMSESYG